MLDLFSLRVDVNIAPYINYEFITFRGQTQGLPPTFYLCIKFYSIFFSFLLYITVWTISIIEYVKITPPKIVINAPE